MGRPHRNKPGILSDKPGEEVVEKVFFASRSDGSQPFSTEEAFLVPPTPKQKGLAGSQLFPSNTEESLPSLVFTQQSLVFSRGAEPPGAGGKRWGPGEAGTGPALED